MYMYVLFDVTPTLTRKELCVWCETTYDNIEYCTYMYMYRFRQS
jgi:hypothetical protein